MAKTTLKTQNGKSIIIDDNNEIHRGGEGRIIVIPSEKGKVAKIYHQGLKPISEKRFKQLQKLDSELFIKPLDLLYLNNKIVGYIMEYAGKNCFPISSLFNRSFCQRNAISYTFKKTIADKLINAVKMAHFNGFVIGDLNQYNVLVDLAGNIKLIDVDSYETPGNKHTGVLLDDIRDYYYRGEVSMNSDYFALSVLLFYLLTYAHPFKGVHQKYKTLAERMINQIPVFVNDILLKVPKCYEPIQNHVLQTKFEKIYLEGERFLISVDGISILPMVKKPVLAIKHDEKDIIIKKIISDADLVNVYFGKTLGYIETKEKFVIYSSKDKSYLTKKHELQKTDYEMVCVGNENILAIKNNRLFRIKEKDNHVEINNFKIPDRSYTYQLENILIVICPGQMYWLYLDEILNQSIKNKRTEVFTEAIQYHNGLIQNTGGVQRLFYHTGKDIASVKIGRNIKQLFQKGNVGMVQYIENEQMINQYFKIKGLQLELMDEKYDQLFEFGYMPDNKGDGFVFEPDDNKLNIRRTEDFKLISEIECSKISKQSSLFSTNAGIILWEEQEVYLINKK